MCGRGGCCRGSEFMPNDGQKTVQQRPSTEYMYKPRSDKIDILYGGKFSYTGQWRHLE